MGTMSSMGGMASRGRRCTVWTCGAVWQRLKSNHRAGTNPAVNMAAVALAMCCASVLCAASLCHAQHLAVHCVAVRLCGSASSRRKTLRIPAVNMAAVVCATCHVHCVAVQLCGSAPSPLPTLFFTSSAQVKGGLLLLQPKPAASSNSSAKWALCSRGQGACQEAAAQIARCR